MGKFNFGIDPASAADAELGEGFYIGDVPPKGNYHGVIKQVKVKLNKNSDHRLNVLVECSEPDDTEKAQYNGAALWCGLNVTEQGTPWVNNFLEVALGLDKEGRKKFWAGQMQTSPGVIDKETAQDVLKIAGKKVVGHEVFVTGEPRTPPGGSEAFEVKRFLEDDGKGGGVRVTSASAAEPDEDATGLGGDETDADDTATDDSGYTEEELTELDLGGLQEICDDWDIPCKKSGKNKDDEQSLIAKILAAQEEGDDAGEEDGASDEDNAEQSALDEDNLTEEDLEEMSKKELIDHMTEKGWADKVPSPAVPSRLRKLVLKLQAEPPF